MDFSGLELNKKPKELDINKLQDNQEITNKNIIIAENKQQSKNLNANIVEDIKKGYKKAVVDYEDTAELGKKVNVKFKLDKASRIEKNARIDEAQVLTVRATADTLNVHKAVTKINSNIKSAEENDSEYMLNSNDYMADIKTTLSGLNKDSFKSAYIKENFAALLEVVRKYEYIKGGYEKKWDLKVLGENKGEVDKMARVIELLRRRLQIYAGKNRIRLDGSVLQENLEVEDFTEEDLLLWEQNIEKYKEPKSSNKDDEVDRIEARELKTEVAAPEPLFVGNQSKLPVLTRAQATTTESDILAQQSREKLRDMNTKLYYTEAGKFKDLAVTINQYIINTRYTAGYTKESKCLRKAKEAVERALKIYEENDLLKDIGKYFEKLTMGSLQVPEGTKVTIRTDDMLEEEGEVKGKKRTWFIEKIMHWSNQEKAPLFCHEPVVNDIKQRLVSNCYMMAATAGIINISPELLKGCLRDNGDGTVTVRLYTKEEQEGKPPKYKPEYYVISKTVPRIGIGKASMDALSAGSLWMQMIEKAYAFHGRKKDGVPTKGYRSLWYGNGNDFIETLLGVPTYDTGEENKQVQLQSKAGEDAFWQAICHLPENKMVFSTGTSDMADKKGWDTGHAYTILGGVEIGNKRYVKLRNPYSNHSFQYKNETEKSKTGGIAPFSNHADSTYGQFLVELDEFARNVSAVYCNDLFDKVSSDTSETPNEVQKENHKKMLEALMKKPSEKKEYSDANSDDDF